MWEGRIKGNRFYAIAPPAQHKKKGEGRREFPAQTEVKGQTWESTRVTSIALGGEHG